MCIRDSHRAQLNPLLHYIAHGKDEGKIFQYAYSVRRKEEICETNSVDVYKRQE